MIHGGDRGTGKWRKPPANCYSLGLPKNAPPADSTVTIRVVRLPPMPWTLPRTVVRSVRSADCAIVPGFPKNRERGIRQLLHLMWLLIDGVLHAQGNDRGAFPRLDAGLREKPAQPRSLPL